MNTNEILVYVFLGSWLIFIIFFILFAHENDYQDEDVYVGEIKN